MADLVTLPKQISKVAGQPASVRVGTVVSTNPLQVQVQETIFQDVGILGSYFPVAGETVALLGQSNAAGSDPTSWLALGVPSGSGNLGVQSGVEVLSFGPATSFTLLVTFARPYAVAPAVFTNIGSAAGSTAGWISRAITINFDNFTLFVSGALNTWTNIPVNWMAVPMNQ